MLLYYGIIVCERCAGVYLWGAVTYVRKMPGNVNDSNDESAAAPVGVVEDGRFRDTADYVDGVKVMQRVAATLGFPP